MALYFLSYDGGYIRKLGASDFKGSIAWLQTSNYYDFERLGGCSYGADIEHADALGFAWLEDHRDGAIDGEYVAMVRDFYKTYGD